MSNNGEVLEVLCVIILKGNEAPSFIDLQLIYYAKYLNKGVGMIDQRILINSMS